VNDTVAVLSIVGAIIAGSPILFAAVGEILTQRSGVMNLGVEGMMLSGAVVGFWATNGTGSLLLGMLAGAVGGALLALIHAMLSVSLRANQVISGLALVIIGTGFSAFLGHLGEDPLSRQRAVVRFSPVFGEGFQNVPIVGPILLSHDMMVYVSWLLVALSSYYIYRTRPGLALRAVGEDPATADSAGISVSQVRYLHTLMGGAFAGIGGAYLSVEVLGSWQSGITSGTGWIAFAVVIFSGWRPWRGLLAAYAFGGLTNLGFTLQLLGVGIPSDFLSMLPFILTIVALILISNRRSSIRKVAAPAALAVPYVREAR
jgi:ABC-type uncharacterized transport system permease subunit